MKPITATEVIESQRLLRERHTKDIEKAFRSIERALIRIMENTYNESI